MIARALGAVFVTYHPREDFLANIAKVTQQGVHVTVVDNSPEGESLPIGSDLEQCEVIRNGRNLGIAAALNIGIRKVLSRGCSWVLLFDQDSLVCDGFVKAMLRAARTAKSQSSVGIICPRYRDARLGVTLPTQKNRAGEIVGCMTSGSMINVRAFQTLGPMEEQLFIDYVDHEYCLRIRAAGWKIVKAPDAVLLHSLGRTSFHRFLGRGVSTTNHSPKRRYYIYRNRLVLIRRYLTRDWQWVSHEMRQMAVEGAKVALFEDQKLAKVKFMALGFYDALRGRLGPRVAL